MFHTISPFLVTKFRILDNEMPGRNQPAELVKQKKFIFTNRFLLWKGIDILYCCRTEYFIKAIINQFDYIKVLELYRQCVNGEFTKLR